MVTGTAGYRGRGPATGLRWSMPSLLLLLLLVVPLLADARRAAVNKRKHHHWKANVIKNHLKSHKSLEGMVRLVDGQSEYEGMNRKNESTSSSSSSLKTCTRRPFITTRTRGPGKRERRDSRNDKNTVVAAY